MGQDASDSQEEQHSSSTNLTPAEVDHPTTLLEDFSLAKISELGMVLFYERSLENGGKMSLSVFVNKDRAWLDYWQVDEDHSYVDRGYQSYNPSYDGPENTELPYTLDHGQVDWYPSSWTILVDEALHAVEYFLSGEGAMAPWVAWRAW